MLKQLATVQQNIFKGLNDGTEQLVSCVTVVGQMSGKRAEGNAGRQESGGGDRRTEGRLRRQKEGEQKPERQNRQNCHDPQTTCICDFLWVGHRPWDKERKRKGRRTKRVTEKERVCEKELWKQHSWALWSDYTNITCHNTRCPRADKVGVKLRKLAVGPLHYSTSSLSPWFLM